MDHNSSSVRIQKVYYLLWDAKPLQGCCLVSETHQDDGLHDLGSGIPMINLYLRHLATVILGSFFSMYKNRLKNLKSSGHAALRKTENDSVTGWGSIPISILLMEEILHHPGCTKPRKKWDKLPINWCMNSSISSITDNCLMISNSNSQRVFFQLLLP